MEAMWRSCEGAGVLVEVRVSSSNPAGEARNACAPYDMFEQTIV